jgi:hypothetical protein
VGVRFIVGLEAGKPTLRLDNVLRVIDALGGEVQLRGLPSSKAPDQREGELPHRPMLAGKDGLRLSLAGAQDKLPVVFDGARIGLPLNGAPSSHILKPTIHATRDSVTNAGFCMALAEAMQLKLAKSKVHRVLDRSFLLVERYDRLIDAQGQRQRLHQEDFCQALGVVPEVKYQIEGGPDLAQCFDLLRSATRPNAPEVLRLLDDVILNVLIGNHDAHAKNFALLYSGKGPRSGTALRHALDNGISNADTEDGDENRQQVQVQRRPGAALGAVCRRRRL